MAVMKYPRLIATVARKTGWEETYVKEIIDCMARTIIENAMSGHTIQIDNFGSFALKFLNRRTISRNYISGESAMSPMHFKLTFKEYMPVRQRICEIFKDVLVEKDELD